MRLKYHYVFLIATNGLKSELVTTLHNFNDLNYLKSVVVVNGPNSEQIKNQYLEACSGLSILFLALPQKGKSRALNYYINSIDWDNGFLIFSDDDIVIDKGNIRKYVAAVEQIGRGYFYGGGVDVVREVEVPESVLTLYPASIRGVSEKSLPRRKIYLGCNWGAFVSDVKAVGLFNPYFGPGSITGSVGQESQMMQKLLDYGLKPYAIPDCRVIHHAPGNYHELQWLLRRKYREGLQKGLLTDKFMKTFIRSSIPLFKGDSTKRKTALHFLAGMLASLKYSFNKIH